MWESIKSCRVEASRGGEEAAGGRVELCRRKGIGLQIDIGTLFNAQIEFMESAAEGHWTIGSERALGGD